MGAAQGACPQRLPLHQLREAPEEQPLPLGQPPVLPSQEECSPTSPLSLEAGLMLIWEKGMQNITDIIPGPPRLLGESRRDRHSMLEWLNVPATCWAC